MKHFRIVGMIIVALAILFPGSAFAEWKVYYTGKAAKMFGSYGRGNFGTRSQCEAYRSSSAGFERSNSYCSGSDAASSKASKQKSPGGSGGATEQAKQLQLQREQKEKEKELERQQIFERDKEQLLSALKGTDSGTGALELKMPQANVGRQPAPVDPKVMREQDEFAKMNDVWMSNQKKLVQQRIEEPNKWSDAIYASLKTKAPPLPYKKFDEMQAGDVLLIGPDGLANAALNKMDQTLSGSKLSGASHTVLYLKEINGKKLFLDNIPGEGPRIILEDEFFKRYGHRDAQVAKLAQYGVAQPLDKKEGDRLYAAAREMADKNREKEKSNNWFDKTSYGVWKKENVVCSEADWALLKAAGRKLPTSGDRVKEGLGIDFSPADFYSNEQYFLVSPLGMPK